MKSKLLLILSILSLNCLSAEPSTDMHEPSISYERLIEILSKYKHYPKGWSLLNYAIEQEDYAAALVLVEYTADINKKDELFNALARVFKKAESNRQDTLNGQQVTLVKKLIQYGINIHLELYHDPLCKACRFNLVDIVIYLLDNGVDVNGNSGSALFWSIQSKHLNLVSLLIERGADVNIRDNLGYAIKLKNNEITNVLIDAGARLKPDGYNLNLMHAFHSLDIEMMNLLLVNGADPNFLDPKNTSSKSVLVEALKIYNASKTSHETIEYYSTKRQKQLELIELLIRYGAKL